MKKDDVVLMVDKCKDCYLRYHCDEQTKFICKHNDYCKYIRDKK